MRPRRAIAWVPEIRPYYCSLAVFGNEKSFSSYLAKLDGFDVHPAVPRECFGRFGMSKDHNAYAIFLRHGVHSSTLVHELAHTVIHLFDRIGLVIEHSSSEAFTYLIADLYRQIFDRLYEEKMRKRK